MRAVWPVFQIIKKSHKTRRLRLESNFEEVTPVRVMSRNGLVDKVYPKLQPYAMEIVNTGNLSAGYPSAEISAGGTGWTPALSRSRNR